MSETPPSPDKLPQEVREAIGEAVEVMERAKKMLKASGFLMENGAGTISTPYNVAMDKLRAVLARPSPAASGEGQLKEHIEVLRAALKAYVRADEFTNALERQANDALRKTRPSATLPAAAAPKDSGEDTRRLDWLHANGCDLCESDGGWYVSGLSTGPTDPEANPRAAIDAAMNPATGDQA